MLLIAIAISIPIVVKAIESLSAVKIFASGKLRVPTFISSKILLHIPENPYGY